MRDLCVQRRTSVMNQTRGLLSEYGVVSPKGHKAFLNLIGLVSDPEHETISAALKVQLRLVREEYQQLTDRICGIQKELISIVAQQPQSSIQGQALYREDSLSPISLFGNLQRW